MAGTAAPDLEMRLELAGAIDLALSLQPWRMGPLDPTMRIGGTNVVKATRTADGPVTVLFEASPERPRVRVQAWGPGASRVEASADAWLGAQDQPDALQPVHPSVSRAHRAHRGLRLGQAPCLWEVLVASILEQRVTWQAAANAWRGLAQRWGEPAPGPFDLQLFPTPRTLFRLPVPAWNRFGVEARRATTLHRVCVAAGRGHLEELRHRGPQVARQRLESIRGIGPWTSGRLTGFGLGDPDAVVVGDLHLPHLVSRALAGEHRGSDERMLELLEPYRGQRFRVIRLLLSGRR